MMKMLPATPTTSARVSVRRISTLATALGALALTGGLFSAGGFLTLPTAFCAALLSALVMWSSLAPEGVESSVPDLSTGKCLALGCLFGGLNAFPSFLATTLVLGEFSWVREFPVVVIFVGLAGLFVGVPLGLLFSAFYAIPLARARRLHNRDNLDSRDRMLNHAGAWLVSVATASLAFGMIVGIPACGGAFTRDQPLSPLVPIGIACLPALVTGLAFITISGRRLRARKSWIKRVARGQEPDWAIIQKEDLIERVANLRPLTQDCESLEHVLVRVADAKGHGAYRQGKELVPWALVDGDTES